jgi:hypothetical protein
MAQVLINLSQITCLRFGYKTAEIINCSFILLFLKMHNSPLHVIDSKNYNSSLFYYEILGSYVSKVRLLVEPWSKDQNFITFILISFSVIVLSVIQKDFPNIFLHMELKITSGNVVM